VKESIKCHSQFCGSPWYGAKLDGAAAEGEKKPDAKAQSENDAEPEAKEGEEKPKTEGCDIGSQVQKAIDCREKHKPLQQKVVESFLRDHKLCGRGLAQIDAEPHSEGEGEGEGEFCGYAGYGCGASPVAIQHVGCCPKEEDKPLPQRVAESVKWRMHNWCTPWKGEEKKAEEAKPEAKA
jgi:hypothetical protein